MGNSNHQGQDHRALLKQIARRAMTEYGLLPDFSPSAISQAQQARPANAQAPAAGGTTAAPAALRDLRAPAVVLDRQRRLDGPRPVDRVRAAARRLRPRPGRHRGRRRAGRGRQRHRPARAAEHDVGLYAGRDLPDAARAAVHRPHLARLRRGTARDCRRLRRRRQRLDRRGDRLPRVGRQPREARVQQRGGMARGPRPDAPGDGGRSRHGRAGPRPGRGGPAAAEVAIRARSSRLPDDRDTAGLRREQRPGPLGGARQPRPPADRGLHGRGQRRDGEVPPGQGLSLDPPRGAVARALGPPGGAGRAVRRAPVRRRRIRARSPSSSPRGGPRIRSASPTCRCRSSSCSAPASTSSRARTRREKDISAWP